MTFRKDSDFPFLYGHIDKLKDHQADVNALIEKFGRENSGLKGEKNKAVAWFASNCQSESLREDYVTELKKHIQVQQCLDRKKKIVPICLFGLKTLENKYVMFIHGQL